MSSLTKGFGSGTPCRTQRKEDWARFEQREGRYAEEKNEIWKTLNKPELALRFLKNLWFNTLRVFPSAPSLLLCLESHQNDLKATVGQRPVFIGEPKFPGSNPDELFDPVLTVGYYDPAAYGRSSDDPQTSEKHWEI